MVPEAALQIGLSSWIVQDGNYPDFVRGTTVEFALEAWVRSADLADPGPIGYELVGEGGYRVRAQAVFVHESAAAHEAVCVWDCGFVAYEEGRRTRPGLGYFVEGEFSFGVDPFFYSAEQSRRLPDMPGLLYEWEVQAIHLQTGPRVLSEKNVWERDASQSGWREIEATDAWNDDAGHASYLLTCVARSGPYKPPARLRA